MSVLSSAKANPVLTGDNQIIQIPQGGGTIKVPFYGQRKPTNPFNLEIETPDFEFGRVPPVTPASFGAIPGTNPATIVGSDEEGNKTGTFGKKINESSKKILDKKDTKKDEDVVNKETGDVFTTGEDDPKLVTGGETTKGTTTQSFDFNDVNEEYNSDKRASRYMYQI